MMASHFLYSACLHGTNTRDQTYTVQDKWYGSDEKLCGHTAAQICDAPHEKDF